MLSSGVYRYGSLPNPAGREMIFYRDGRTATVAVGRQVPDSFTWIATNGKPDASLDRAWFSAPDTTHLSVLHGDISTQVLIPLITLAHMPSAKLAAVIGQGSGMTSHFLLGSSDARASGDDRDRAADDRGLAPVLSGESPRVRRQALALRRRRREVVLRHRCAQVRPHHLGAVQSVGERRGGVVHRRVLSSRARLPHAERRVRPVAAPLRDQRRARGERARGDSQEFHVVLGVSHVERRHAHRRLESPRDADARLERHHVAGDRSPISPASFRSRRARSTRRT